METFKIDKGMEEKLKTQEWSKMVTGLREKGGIADTSQMTWDQIENKYREITGMNERSAPYTRWHSLGKPKND